MKPSVATIIFILLLIYGCSGNNAEPPADGDSEIESSGESDSDNDEEEIDQDNESSEWDIEEKPDGDNEVEDELEAELEIEDDDNEVEDELEAELEIEDDDNEAEAELEVELEIEDDDSEAEAELEAELELEDDDNEAEAELEVEVEIEASVCGNNNIEDDEACELGDVIDCTTLGSYFLSGTAQCGSDCTKWDTSGCEWDQTTFPQGYCDHNLCFKVPPTNQLLCAPEDSSTPLENCPDVAGSATCGSTELCGQDAQYPDTERTFTCFDSGGTETACANLSVASENEVVTDSLTGLMWQRWIPNTFTNCENGSACSFQESINYCDSLIYAGYEDWRTPGPHELDSIVDDSFDHDISEACIDRTAFPDTPVTSFWTKADYLKNSKYSWYSYFLYGYITNGLDNSRIKVRCVRGGADTQGDWTLKRFTVSENNNEEIVQDLITGLVWAKSFSDTAISWADALSYCENLSYGSYTDWRLPNKKEITSLVNYSIYDPASEFPDMPVYKFWSSTSYYFVSYALSADFSNGDIVFIYKPNTNCYARCVRDDDGT